MQIDANRGHKAPSFYTECRGNPCICDKIAARDPSMTYPANRASFEKYYGALPSDEQIIKKYEARYGNA